MNVTRLAADMPGAAKCPSGFGIASVCPNPFNSELIINFVVKEPSKTALMMFDISGREVSRLYDGVPEAGLNRIAWNGRDLPSGVYFIRMKSGDRLSSVKALLVR